MNINVVDDDFDSFSEKAAATAIANQAILKCIIRGVPLSVDTVIPFVGDFLPPTDDRFHRVAVLIKAALEDMLDPTSPHMVKN